MAIGDDLSVTRANGNIRATGGTVNYTVLELHRWLQQLGSDASSVGDDEYDITDLTAASRRNFDTIIVLNAPYNIDDATAQRLYGGSITQDSGNTRYSGLQIAGTFPDLSTAPEVIQDHVKLTAFWNAALTFNPDTLLGFSHQFLVKTRTDGVDIDGGRVRVQSRGYGFSFREASTVLGVGNGVAAVGAIVADAFNDVTEANVQLSPYTTVTNDATGLIALIDLLNGNGAQPYYSEWNPNSTDLSGLYNRVKYLTRMGEATNLLGGYGIPGELFRGVTHEIVYDTEVGGDAAKSEEFGWGTFVNYTGTGGFTIGEAVSWAGGALGRVLSEDTVNNSLLVNVESGTPADTELITGLVSAATATQSGAAVGQATGGGRAIILANEVGGAADGTVWVQLIAGTVPADDTILYDAANHTHTITVNVTVEAESLPLNSVLGDFFGSLLGGYGVGVVAGALSASDQLIDLNGVTQTPPNNVQVRVLGVEGGVSDQDRVILGLRSAGVLVTNEDTSLADGPNPNTVGSGTFRVSAAIPLDKPQPGTVRIFDTTNNSFARVPYTSYSGQVYTLTGTLPFTVPDATNVFTPFLDDLGSGGTLGQEDGNVSATVQFQANRDVIGVVRSTSITAPIQEFPLTGTITASGFEVTAVRTPDA